MHYKSFKPLNDLFFVKVEQYERFKPLNDVFLARVKEFFTQYEQEHIPLDYID